MASVMDQPNPADADAMNLSSTPRMNDEDDLSEAEEIMDESLREFEEDLLAHVNPAPDARESSLSVSNLRSSSTSFHSSHGNHGSQEQESELEEDVPVTDKAEVQKSIQKGKNELSKSRLKAHAKQTEEDLKAEIDTRGFSASAPVHTPDKSIPSSSRSSSSRSRPKISRTLSREEPTRSNASAGEKLFTGRKEKRPSRRPDGFTTTPKRNPKKLSVEGIEGAAALSPVEQLAPNFSKSRLPPPLNSLDSNAKAKLLESDDCHGSITKSLPERSQSMQAQWKESRVAYLEKQKKLRGDVDPKSWEAWNQSSQSSTSMGTSRTTNRSKYEGGVPCDSHADHNQSSKTDDENSGNIMLRDTDFLHDEGSDPPRVNLAATINDETFQDIEWPAASTKVVQNRSSSSMPQNPEDGKTGFGKNKSHTEEDAIERAKSQWTEDNKTETGKNLEKIEVWSCWACESDSNPIAHVFCGMCGTSRDWICLSQTCKHENKSSFGFCGMCGSKKGADILHKQEPDAFDMRISWRSVPRLPPRGLSGDSVSGRTKLPKQVFKDSVLGTPRRQLSKDSTNARPSRPVSFGTQSSIYTPPSPTQSVEAFKTAGRSRQRLPSDDIVHSDEHSHLHSDTVRSSRRDRKPREGREEGKDSRSVDGKSRPKKNRSHSSSRLAPQRGRDAAKGERRHRTKKKEEKGRHDATSVPAGDRRETKAVTDAVTHFTDNTSAAERPTLDRTNSMGELDKQNPSSEPLIPDQDDDYAANRKVASSSRMAGVLATPSMKKRFFQIGGKVKGVGEKLFKGSDMPMLNQDVHDGVHVNGEVHSDPTLQRVSSADNVEDIVTRGSKAVKVNKEGKLVPATPSLTKRLLKMKPWGKSEHGKATAAPDMTLLEGGGTEHKDEEGAPAEITDTGETEESNNNHPEEEYENFLANTGIVMTASDVRPNRPGVSRPQRRKSGRSSLIGGVPGDSRRSSNSNGNSSSKRKPSRKVSRTKSGDGLNPRRRSSRQSHRDGGQDSDHSSSVSSAGRGLDLGKHDDPLGDRVSESESIRSEDFEHH